MAEENVGICGEELKVAAANQVKRHEVGADRQAQHPSNRNIVT